jgi:hypothetical protein
LYQGTASAVPEDVYFPLGFSPCSQRLKPLSSAAAHGTTGSRALLQICFRDKLQEDESARHSQLTVDRNLALRLRSYPNIGATARGMDLEGSRRQR